MSWTEYKIHGKHLLLEKRESCEAGSQVSQVSVGQNPCITPAGAPLAPKPLWLAHRVQLLPEVIADRCLFKCQWRLMETYRCLYIMLEHYVYIASYSLLTILYSRIQTDWNSHLARCIKSTVIMHSLFEAVFSRVPQFSMFSCKSLQSKWLPHHLAWRAHCPHPSDHQPTMLLKSLHCKKPICAVIFRVFGCSILLTGLSHYSSNLIISHLWSFSSSFHLAS